MCEPKYLMLPWGIQSIPVHHRQGIMMAVFYLMNALIIPFFVYLVSHFKNCLISTKKLHCDLMILLKWMYHFLIIPIY